MSGTKPSRCILLPVYRIQTRALPDAGSGQEPVPCSGGRRRSIAGAGVRVASAATLGALRVPPSNYLEVLRSDRDHPGLGYTKTRNARRWLRIEIGRTAVANLLAEAGLEREPERNRWLAWKRFLRSHWETLYACDLFAVETLGVFGTVRHLVCFVIELSRETRLCRQR